MRDQACQRAMTQKQTLGGRFEVMAYSSFSIFVSLRIAASLVTPSFPMPLTERLQRRGGARMVREQACQRALTQKQTLSGRQAHFSEVTALPLSPSHSFVIPSAV